LQVRVMTALRHPNVVLFMAASTKVGEMCIVMEFMALGSLFDVRRLTLPSPFTLCDRLHSSLHYSCCTTS
jgi:serine/threonine protein kinase